MATYLEQTNRISVEKLATNTIQNMRVLVTIKNYYYITMEQTFISSTDHKLYTKNGSLLQNYLVKKGVKIIKINVLVFSLFWGILGCCIYSYANIEIAITN